MKKSSKILLSIIFTILATIFMVLSILGFFPVSWKRWTDILVIIILCKWLIEVLSSVNKDEKKDK